MVRKAEKVAICTGHFEMSMMSTVIFVLLLHKLNASHVQESKRHTYSVLDDSGVLLKERPP